MADVTVTDPNNGGSAELRIGQILDIVLPDDYKTSKCQWSNGESSDETVLTPLGSRYEPDRTPPSGGAPGTSTSRFKATGAGTAHVTLTQQDNGNPARVVRHFAIDVNVR